MRGATPVEVLEAEHRVIQKMVAGVSVLAEQLEGGEPVDVALLESFVVFLRTFADRCRYGREETFLFPALICRGVPPHGCPTGGLTMEHPKGRVMVAELPMPSAVAPRENLPRERPSLRACARWWPSILIAFGRRMTAVSAGRQGFHSARSTRADGQV